MSSPEITVLMPAYNAQKYIGEAIESVLSQTFENFELLIINDGSTDQTSQLILSYTDERIRVINQDNKGIAIALNNGLNYAKSNLIARFDADDICLPQRLEIQYNFMKANPTYSLIGSGVDYIDIDKNHVFTHLPEANTYSEIRQLNYTTCPFIHSSVCYKKEVVMKYGGYNAYAYTFEDHLLWLKLLQHEEAYNLPQSLIKVRLNPESITIDEKWRTPTFRKIKNTALKKHAITEKEGIQLLEIGKNQHEKKIKEGAYYALLGKKYLWNNYDPVKARKNLFISLKISPFHFKNFFLIIASFLPKKTVAFFYQFVKKINQFNLYGFSN
jgi:glycosyltransferase involved in cell wall biosynthesis